MKFKNLNLTENILKAIDELGFEEPTPIQEKSISHIMEGKDLIGEAATGSGKTLAFGCGIIKKAESKRGIQALVLTPTRELARQVQKELKKFTGYKKLKITTVYGGVGINPQIKALQTAEIVVGTPGRLLDHMQRGTIDLRNVKILVLDEADRMLDMGFIDDVEKIISQCPEQRQTLFFSATMPSVIKKLANKHMKNQVEVKVNNQVDPRKLKQEYYNVDKNMKFSVLVHLLKNEKSGLVMVFCNTRKNTDFVAMNLKKNGINATAIHGGLSQHKRTGTMNNFKEGEAQILVCTDVAARGLHINDVSHVYNYDIPKDPKDYVHRIGRTARAGEKGKVINILCEYDYDNFGRIERDYSFDIDKKETPYVKKIPISKSGHQRKGKRRYSKRKFSRGRRR